MEAFQTISSQLIAELLLADNQSLDLGTGTIVAANIDQSVVSGANVTFGKITIFDSTPILVFKDSDSLGAASVGFIEWRDAGGGRAGFLGNNTSGNDDLLWKNEQGGNIGIQTTGAGKFQIFANVELNDNSITGMGNITGSDVDIEAGTGSYNSTGTIRGDGGISIGGAPVADTVLIETSDTDDPGITLRTTNTTHGIKIILDEDAVNDRLCIEGQTASVDTHLCLHAQDGEAMKLQLFSGATNRTDLIMGVGDNFSIQNFVENKNIAFTVNNGGTPRTITLDGTTFTLQSSTGSIAFGGTNFTGVNTINCGTITSLANIMTLGNNGSANDTVVWWKSSGNDGRITYDQTADEFLFGNTGDPVGSSIHTNLVKLSSLQARDQAANQVTFGGGSSYEFRALRTAMNPGSISAIKVLSGALGTDIIVFNEDGDDVDFRFEGLSDVNLLFLDGSTDRAGIGTATLDTKFRVAGAIASASSTFSTGGPTDNVDVSGINTLFIDASSNAVTIGGFAGGVDGQVLRVVRIEESAHNVTIENNEGGATQVIFLHKGADETLTSEFGGWTFICHDGIDWHDTSHAKHV